MSEVLEQLARSGTRAGHLAKCIILIVLCLAAFAPGISRLPPTDRDESRYMQATRQMVASGEFVDIRFQDQPRYLQPAGVYWLQTLAVTVGGEGADTPAWVFRTVSVVAATLAVLACYAAGVRIFGPAAGFIAAAGLVGIFMLNFEARIAKTDATILATSLTMQAALAWVYLGVRQQRPIPLAAPLIFWLAMGAGLMVKGPIVPGLALLTITALSIYDRDLSWARKLRPLIGLAIVVLVASPWFIAITAKSGLVFWKIALGKSLFGKIQGGQQSHGFPPGYYLILCALTIWPYALETLRGGLRGLNVLRRDPRIAFCVAWSLPMWFAFELVPTKLPHYVLPLYPAHLIVMGWWLTDPAAREIVLRRWQQWLTWAATAGWAIVTAGLATIAIGLTPFLTGAWNVGGFVAAALVLVAGWLGSGFRPPVPPVARIVAASLAAAAFAGTMASQVLPPIDKIWPSRALARLYAEAAACPDSMLISAGYAEPSLVFLTSADTLLTDGVNAAGRLVQRTCDIAAVTSEYDAAFQSTLASLGHKPEAVGKVDAFNYSNGKPVSITLYRLASKQ